MKCVRCNFSSDNLCHLQLHLGSDHGEFERLIKVWRTKHYSIKDISLDVDSTKRYVIEIMATVAQFFPNHE